MSCGRYRDHEGTHTNLNGDYWDDDDYRTPTEVPVSRTKSHQPGYTSACSPQLASTPIRPRPGAAGGTQRGHPTTSADQ